ncbi:unnamed protein product, partial [marine sediment metagenome]
MNKIIFSSWAGKVIDNRGLDADRYTEVDNLELPLKYDGHQVAAFISWNGLVVADDSVDVVDMARSYIQEVSKLACGQCTVGYNGVRVIAQILSKIASGQGSE